MPTEKPNHKVMRRYPLFPTQQKESIRQEVLALLRANPSLYLGDLKTHLVTKYKVAKQTAYQWLRDWAIG